MHNKNDSTYETMFNDLVQEAFHFTFAPWHALKLWDDRYESYSFIENGRMLASICIYKMDMLICGKPYRVHQLGAVATRTDHRNKGLSRLLMEHIFSIYPGVPAMLFANSTVLHFYPRFGFHRIYESTPVLTYSLDNKDMPPIRLTANDERLISALDSRWAYSKLMDVVNIQPVQRFHLLQIYSNDIYYLAALDVAIVARQTGSKLLLAAVFSKQDLLFSELAVQLPFSGVEQIEFGFSPDWLGVKPDWEVYRDDETALFIRGDLKYPDVFKFPALSST